MMIGWIFIMMTGRIIIMMFGRIFIITMLGRIWRGWKPSEPRLPCHREPCQEKLGPGQYHDHDHYHHDIIPDHSRIYDDDQNICRKIRSIS